jgi:hypothetical protein
MARRTVLPTSIRLTVHIMNVYAHGVNMAGRLIAGPL